MISETLPAPFSHLGLNSVGSTNDEVRRRVQDGSAADLLVVTAKRQTSGRGRRGRVWESPEGNLHASFAIRVERPLAEAAQIGFVAALALAEALDELVPGHDVRVKWPNDVLVDGRKVAGMLLESVGDGWLVLGIGVDVECRPAPSETLYATIALAELGYGGDSMVVLGALCRHFGPWLDLWRAEGFAPIRAGWLQWARGLGEAALVRLEAETLSGVFKGLDEEGGLLLDQGEAGIRRVLAGDVFFPGL
ncbi:Biotin-protein ligase [Paramagnetospirillum magnetotacticum MS-1]|uniref:biotin--[biotin carboxyl-carrier protein] ligase n=1 Tax=Paramagnetospirillum magnetotacticum MS-1 TaxID=272627 RepID=A0A0C2YUI1_PARME|nr:biotin--[acetyl-CoA-carboxylase] ligase [Paramagnetospirillum magnetotacticum]KIL98365.1 Biotin-protein ligase [Paramagnetospirillum magnetotacticum MS-1]